MTQWLVNYSSAGSGHGLIKVLPQACAWRADNQKQPRQVNRCPRQGLSQVPPKYKCYLFERLKKIVKWQGRDETDLE
jgi:hypothetical protein